MHTLPPASASCEALRRETRDPKRVSWAVVTVDAALADNTTPRQPTGDLTMSSGRRGDGARAGVQHVCFCRAIECTTIPFYLGCLRDPGSLHHGLHGGAWQWAANQGAEPFTPHLDTVPRAVWTQKNSRECQGLPQVTESGFWPPPASPPNHGSPSPRITVSILMPAAGDQTASDLTTPRSTDIFAAGLA